MRKELKPLSGAEIDEAVANYGVGDMSRGDIFKHLKAERSEANKWKRRYEKIAYKPMLGKCVQRGAFKDKCLADNLRIEFLSRKWIELTGRSNSYGVIELRITPEGREAYRKMAAQEETET